MTKVHPRRLPKARLGESLGDGQWVNSGDPLCGILYLESMVYFTRLGGILDHRGCLSALLDHGMQDLSRIQFIYRHLFNVYGGKA